MQPLDERAKRIVDCAIALAERDGLASVRLRDVASDANVALGTVYKRFSSKEDILVAGLGRISQWLHDGQQEHLTLPTPFERVRTYFTRATQKLCERPNVARALVRALASGDPSIAQRVEAYHALNASMVITALRGETQTTPNFDPKEKVTADILSAVWFSALVNWAGQKDSGTNSIVQAVEDAARLLLAS